LCQSHDDDGKPHSSGDVNDSLSSSSNTLASHVESGAESSNLDNPVLGCSSKSDTRSEKFAYTVDYAHSRADGLVSPNDDFESDGRSDGASSLRADIEQRDLNLLPRHISGQLPYCHVSTVFRNTHHQDC